jgi:membrane associated rhomboid family serine protease
MSVNDLEQRVNDLERRHERTRALLLDALSAAAILLIGFIFRPEGWHAVLSGLAAGLVVPRLIASVFLRDATPVRRRGPAPVAPWRGLDRRSIGNRKAAG